MTCTTRSILAKHVLTTLTAVFAVSRMHVLPVIPDGADVPTHE